MYYISKVIDSHPHLYGVGSAACTNDIGLQLVLGEGGQLTIPYVALN